MYNIQEYLHPTQKSYTVLRQITSIKYKKHVSFAMCLMTSITKPYKRMCKWRQSSKYYSKYWTYMSGQLHVPAAISMPSIGKGIGSVKSWTGEHNLLLGNFSSSWPFKSIPISYMGWHSGCLWMQGLCLNQAGWISSSRFPKLSTGYLEQDTKENSLRSR
jgi:hypothetical protein